MLVDRDSNNLGYYMRRIGANWKSNCLTILKLSRTLVQQVAKVI